MPTAKRTDRRPTRARPPLAAGTAPAPADAHDIAAGLELDEVLDLRAAAPLKAALVARRGADLRLDASRVRHLGAQCAQLLLAAAAAWAEDGLSFAVAAASEPFAEGARLLGVQSTLLPASSPTPLFEGFSA